MLNKRILIKTIVYRATSTVLKQTIGWILFNQIIINIAIFIADAIIGTIWYYGYETLFERVKKKWTKR